MNEPMPPVLNNPYADNVMAIAKTRLVKVQRD